MLLVMLQVPYRCNRGLVFVGRRFHATDRLHFRPGSYSCRRINLTLLYE